MANSTSSRRVLCVFFWNACSTYTASDILATYITRHSRSTCKRISYTPDPSLAKYQRRMAHKTKFSNNWKKAKARVQHIHTDIANCRKDFLHKTTSTIAKNHALVCIEDLQVANMSRSAKGSIEKPGRNVRQKSGLNRAILDQGWGEFRRQLDYKLAWNGGLLLPIPAHHTSQTCPCCGHVATANRLTQAAFLCVDCDYQHHADVVGAINILERGYRLLAHGDSVQQGRSVKWEPAEVPQSVVV